MDKRKILLNFGITVWPYEF